jgi:hypothetical protein
LKRTITDKPAKTPRPIGRTDIDFPGRLVFMAPAADTAASVPVGMVVEEVGEGLTVSVDVELGNKQAGTTLVPYE